MKKSSLLLIALCSLYQLSSAQLTGILPNQGIPGQTLNTTITGTGIFIQSSSPSGNLFDVRLRQGGSYITLFDYNNFWMFWNVTVIDPNTVLAELYIPPGATPGLYDLEITTGDPFYPYWNQNFYSVPGAFIVGAPDGYITGTVYNDINKNGIQDAGELGISNRSVKILPANLVLTTDVSGNYSHGTSNGNYSVVLLANTNDQMLVTTSNDTLAVTINNANSSGNNFGLRNSMISITPEAGMRGLPTLHQLVAEDPIFVPGPNAWGNVSQLGFFTSPFFTVFNSFITVIDSFTIQVMVTPPANTVIGNNFNIRVYVNSGPYAGYHYLKQKFDIIAAPAFISGKAFFDQNLNKQFDVGEPGIFGIKMMLNPDSSFAFTNYLGDFQFTSLGGPQTLSYQNNIAGLSLYTDSVTYTFNAAGNITGKNFGFVSTEPDYAIKVTNVYIFPRCNSNQTLAFTIRNTSNITYNFKAWIKLDPLMTFVSSPNTTTIVNDTLYFNPINIAPYTDVVIYSTFLMPAAGNILQFVPGAYSLDAFNVIQSSHSLPQTRSVTCAMDPNDKQVTPPGMLAEHFTCMSDTLLYLIRFQNTGNDTAINVVILDTLDSDLNLGTMEILGCSHSMKTQVWKNGAAKFTFNNIMLVDSNMNEPLSHGYIRYSIRAKPGLVDSTKVNNTAHIFFDFNSDVVTNTTLNTLVYILPGDDPLPVELAEFTGTVKENFNYLKWVTLSEVNNNYFDLERSVNGNDFIKIASMEGSGTTSSVSTYLFRDYGIEEQYYYYRLKQVDFDGAFAYSNVILVKRESEANDFINAVIPNPFVNKLTIVFAGTVNEPVTIELFNTLGKEVQSYKADAEGTFCTFDLSGSNILPGAYLLRVTTEQGTKSFKIFKQ